VLIQHGKDEFILDFLQVIRQPIRVVSRVILPKSVMAKFVAVLGQHLNKNQPAPQTHEPATPEQSALDSLPHSPPPTEPATLDDENESHQQKSTPDTPSDSAVAQSNPITEAPSGPPSAQGPAEQTPPPQNKQFARNQVEEANHSGDIANLYKEYKLTDELAAGAYANVVMISQTASLICMDFIARFPPTPMVTARVQMTMPDALRLLQTLAKASPRPPSDNNNRPKDDLLDSDNG
jgi:hypothetical protein